MKYLLTLQQHQWKAIIRHPLFERTILMRLLSFISLSALFVYMMIFGYMLDTILLKTGSYTTPSASFNAGLLYLLVTDFVLKSFLKTNKTIQIMPYLTLPVKRNTLFNFLILKETGSLWNLYLPIFLLPFSLKVLIPETGTGNTLYYLFCLYLLMLISSLCAMYVKKLYDRSLFYILIPIGIFAAVLYIAFGLNAAPGDYTQQYGQWILNGNILAGIPLIIGLAGCWMLNTRQMRESVYQTAEGEQTTGKRANTFNLFKNPGTTGELIMLEIRLMMRAKRIRTQLFMSAYMVGVYLYLLVMNTSFIHNSVFWEFFSLCIILGIPGIIFSQFLFLIESSYFDGLISRNINMVQFISVKYYMYVLLSTLYLLITVGTLFFFSVSIFKIVACYFYVIGPIYFLGFQTLVYSKKRFNLFDKAWNNYNGTSSAMILINFISLGVPLGVSIGINYLISPAVAHWFMLITGVFFVAIHKYWISWTYQRFCKRKYANMEGFRIIT